MLSYLSWNFKLGNIPSITSFKITVHPEQQFQDASAFLQPTFSPTFSPTASLSSYVCHIITSVWFVCPSAWALIAPQSTCSTIINFDCSGMQLNWKGLHLSIPWMSLFKRTRSWTKFPRLIQLPTKSSGGPPPPPPPPPSPRLRFFNLAQPEKCWIRSI